MVENSRAWNHDQFDQTTDAALDPRVSTGVSGLDDILAGGLMANRLYLVEGQPGAGKTTLALQFLLAGRARSEAGHYVTLSETEEELHAVARSHGITLDGIALFELASTKNALSAGHEQALLHPWEVELGETIKLITDKVEATKPTPVVFDSLAGNTISMPEEHQLVLQLHERLSSLNQQGIVTILINTQTGLVGGMQSNGIRIGEPLTQFHGVLTGTPAYRGDGNPLLMERD